MNETSAISDDEVLAMILAFQKQWDKDLQPAWGVQHATLTFVPKDEAPATGTWWVVFLDDDAQAGALAYHDSTNEGLPLAKVFIKDILARSGSVSVSATHEICSMAVDPWLNGGFQDQQGVFWATEICDPVDDDKYAYKIDDVLVTDFVTPNWFERGMKGNIDFNRLAKAPFEILPLGCCQKFDAQQGKWVLITGADAEAKYSGVPSRGSRRDKRGRARKNWECSNARVTSTERKNLPKSAILLEGGDAEENKE
jgi:hypothetical protein